MDLSTICPVLSASPFVASLLELTIELLPWVVRLGQRIVTFRQGPITPITSPHNSWQSATTPHHTRVQRYADVVRHDQ